MVPWPMGCWLPTRSIDSEGVNDNANNGGSRKAGHMDWDPPSYACWFSFFLYLKTEDLIGGLAISACWLCWD